MDIKGIALYLGLSFSLVFVLCFVLISQGAIEFQSPNLFQYLAQVALMGIPAVSALLAGFLVLAKTPADPTRLWPIPLPGLLRVLAMPIAVFAVAYGLAALLGLSHPQWNLAGLLNEVESVSPRPLDPDVRAIAPYVVFLSYPFLSVGLAALFAVVAVASEFGWRGFLLPRLMPLGALPAYVIVGVFWGLWFFPFLYGWHREIGDFDGMAGTQLRFVALGVVLSVVLGQIKNRTQHLGLCALALGGFAAQASGLWEHLFQQSTPPWTGPLGWIIIGCVGVSALLPGLWSGAKPRSIDVV